MRRTSSSGLMIGAALAALALAGVARGQSVEELTVTGRYSDDGQSLSKAVSYADLDLATRDGAHTLRVRIRDTARELCDRLGEGRSESGLGATCQHAAFDGAWKQARVAIAMAEPAGGNMMADNSGSMAATSYSRDVSATAPDATYTTQTVTNGPVPDTPENRARFGGPMSHAGQRTDPSGN